MEKLLKSLSVVKIKHDFETIKNNLRAFDNFELCEEDYEFASEIFNICRAKGIQGSNTDFLVCSGVKFLKYVFI